MDRDLRYGCGLVGCRVGREDWRTGEDVHQRSPQWCRSRGHLDRFPLLSDAGRRVGALCVRVQIPPLLVASSHSSSLQMGRQEIAVWAWTKEDSGTDDAQGSILRSDIPGGGVQHSVRFDPNYKTSIVTTGQASTIFWDWGEFLLDSFVAKVSKKDFGNLQGKFTSSLFLPGTKTAVTSTSDGYVVLWEPTRNKGGAGADKGDVDKGKSHFMKVATKVLRLVECPINTMVTTENGYLALACADGAVRFYDFFFRLEAWFEDMCAGPITSISLSLQENPYDSAEAGSPGLKFWVPNFIVGTTDALVVGVDSTIFDEVNPDDRRGVLLLQGFPDDVSSLACHPSRPLVAFTCHGQGSLHLWDYDMKLLMNLREFTNKSPGKSKTGAAAASDKANTFLPQSIAFEPHGEVLAVGFTTGDLKIMDVESLEDIANFAPSSHAIVSVKFSPSGVYLTGYDAGNHVLLFKRADDGTFVYVGRMLAHASPIAGVDFGYKEGIEMMISVGKDRFCVEYNLENSSSDLGLQCQRQSTDGAGDKLMSKIEATARPTALMWHPRIGDDVEDRFIVATDEFKFKEFNADSKQCRKTTLAPTFGTPPCRMVPIASAGNGRVTHFAYSSDTKVVGIGSFPLAGDPTKVMGINAHPGAISSIAVSYDGKYLFSSGGTDLSSFMYEISVPDPSQEAPSSASASAYLSLLEGGEGGELHEDIIDYFYYCQLRAQGEESMSARSANGEIPLEEIPSLLRAVGFYPSEEEVANMLNEVRYKNFMTTGLLQDNINLSDFVALYVNHRPVVPLSNEVIDRAFATILEREHASELNWAGLKAILQNDGEAITSEDLDAFLAALVGADAKKLAGHHLIDASSFAESVLGFEQ